MATKNAKSKRVLGSPFKSPIPANNRTNDSIDSPIKINQSNDQNLLMKETIEEELTHEEPNGIFNEAEVLKCPICDESMISNLQLNRHIDDIHNQESTSSSLAQPKPQPKLKLDLHDKNGGFTLSHDDVYTKSSSSSPVFKNRLPRTHWQAPSSTTTNYCSLANCSLNLNIKNGIVNCRKCGKLFCNKHTNYKVMLKSTAQKLDYATDKEGIWSRCCETCYYNKPDLKRGTQALSVNLFNDFRTKRQASLDIKQLQRNKIQTRFIKLVNILIKQSLQPKLWFSKSNDAEILDYWQDDTLVTNCSICYVKFNIIIRKHHCRLCGKIVCDDTEGIRKNCSIMVPLNVFVEKLPNLNYSKLVQENMKILQNIQFRCCVNCKDDLLYQWKLENSFNNDDNIKSIFDDYIAISLIKKQVELLLPRYLQSINSTTLNNIDQDEESKNKLRNKLMLVLKDFENQTNQFRNKYFHVSHNKLQVIDSYQDYTRLLTNVYQGYLLFFQENLVEYKSLTNKHQELETQKLALQQKNQQVEEIPRLTKKQVRELREQLMVMREQRFLVINQIDDLTKARKFDELGPLQENKSELENIISSLESELGEFAF